MKNLVIILSLTALFGCDKDTCTPAEPNGDCVCIEVYEPVCGCNDVTYSNSCHAECAGVTEYTSGECGN